MAPHRNGNGLGHSGTGLGQQNLSDYIGFEDFMGDLQSGLQPIVGDIVRQIRPHLTELAREATELAAPKLRQIVKEDIMPKAAVYIIAGLIGAGAIGALVAIWMRK